MYSSLSRGFAIIEYLKLGSDENQVIYNIF